MTSFIHNCLDAKILQYGEGLYVIVEEDPNILKVVVDTILSSATDSYDKLAKDFQNMRQNAIVNGMALTLENPGNDLQVKNDYFFDQSPSNLKILKLLSIILDLSEQLYMLSRTEDSTTHIDALKRESARSHTAYGRLSSFLSSPTTKVHALNLSSEGYLNTGDSHFTLKSYLNPNQLVDPALKVP